MLSRSPQREAKRLVSVSLREVPLQKRLAAYDALLGYLDDPVLMVDLGQAAHFPSDRRYLIPEDAYNKVMRHAA